eukprot:jgi/Ulvmu1/3956/UM018_0179.1
MAPASDIMTPCRLATALLTAAAAAAPAAANLYYYYRRGECGELASLCCFGDGGFECDDRLVCETNVQALLSPGFCVECGALDELPRCALPIAPSRSPGRLMPSKTVPLWHMRSTAQTETA